MLIDASRSRDEAPVESPMHVVICGGGVIGACTAYYLARRGIGVTVVECAEVAAAASGKAGGFLARDWCAGSPLDALARRSFALHASLPQDVGADWAYQRMTSYSGVVPSGRNSRRRAAAGLAWLSGDVLINAQLSTADTTAIVHPRKFTQGMMRAAEQHGARVRAGRVTGVVGRRVDVDGETIAADAIVIAMGPWTLLAAQWVSIPPVFGMQSPSLVYDTGKDVPAEALFLDYEQDDGSPVTVEVFPRADGSTHVTAFGGQTPLPMNPADVRPDPDALAKLQSVCERLSPAFRADRIIARQACFRPVTQDGLPLIGMLAGTDGVYIATGHSVWGILNAPATGEALAELIADGAATTTDLDAFDPGRLRPLDPGSLRIG
jgi:glycine/D-amino acid oxidase-like deaminating enzyme